METVASAVSPSEGRIQCRVRSLATWVMSYCGFLLSFSDSLHAQVEPDIAAVYFDFAQGIRDLAGSPGELVLHGARVDEQGRLEFTTSRQFAEIDAVVAGSLSAALQNVDSLSIGGWFYPWRQGEQIFIERGEPEIGPLGERFFRPSDRMVNFCLGSDERGFFMGTINGNGGMPFVHVTVNELPIQTWQQLVVVKDAAGFHHFYQNGVLVHDDCQASSAPSRQPWNETSAAGDERVRLQMPLGGLIGETWIVPRALTADEIAADFEAKRERYSPAPPGEPVAVREMFRRPVTHARPFDADRVRAAVLNMLGSFPDEIVPLEAEIVSEQDCGNYWRRKVTFDVGPEDRMPCWLLVPKELPEPAPAIICFYGTTAGAGKDVTVELSGREPGTPPVRNLSFAIDMVEAGFVALAPDYLRDGERIHPGDRPYDTTRFYQQYPNWSIHGKDIWDTMRAIDYLQTLDFVDGERIGMIGHSYGGHSTIFTAALEPRIKVAVANGPVSAFREHGMHWAVPQGGGASQSLPAMREFILNPDLPLPVTFAEWTALIAPRPLLVGQAAGERRPIEEQNYGYVANVYSQQDAEQRLSYLWYAGDHDFPPAARSAAVDWFRRWLGN